MTINISVFSKNNKHLILSPFAPFPQPCSAVPSRKRGGKAGIVPK